MSKLINIFDSHDKKCQGMYHVIHARCETTDGSETTGCSQLPAGTPIITPFFMRGTIPTSASKSVTLPDPAWHEIKVITDQCTPSYNEADAHDYHCQKGVHTWHTRCEYQNGHTSPECPSSSKPQVGGLFKGKTIKSVTQLPAKEWLKVEVDNPGCGRIIYYNKEKAHDKGCADEIQTWHLQCEDHQGVYSHDCTENMRPKVGDHYKNGIIDSVEQKPDDQAWIIVKVKDGLCKLRYNEAEAHKKDCSNSVQTWHVRCEDGVGTASKECAHKIRPKVGDQFQGHLVTEVNELANPEWLEVKTTVAKCESSILTKIMWIMGIGLVIILVFLMIGLGIFLAIK